MACFGAGDAPYLTIYRLVNGTFKRAAINNPPTQTCDAGVASSDGTYVIATSTGTDVYVYKRNASGAYDKFSTFTSDLNGLKRGLSLNATEDRLLLPSYSAGAARIHPFSDGTIGAAEVAIGSLNNTESAKWSNDGQYFAIAGRVFGTKFYYYNRAAKTATLITTIPAGGWAIDWHPDDDHIVIAAAAAGNYQSAAVVKRTGSGSGASFAKFGAPFPDMINPPPAFAVAYLWGGDYLQYVAFSTGAAKLYRRSGDTYTLDSGGIPSISARAVYMDVGGKAGKTVAISYADPPYVRAFLSPPREIAVTPAPSLGRITSQGVGRNPLVVTDDSDLGSLATKAVASPALTFVGAAALGDFSSAAQVDKLVDDSTPQDLLYPGAALLSADIGPVTIADEAVPVFWGSNALGRFAVSGAGKVFFSSSGDSSLGAFKLAGVVSRRQRVVVEVGLSPLASEGTLQKNLKAFGAPDVGSLGFSGELRAPAVIDRAIATLGSIASDVIVKNPAVVEGVSSGLSGITSEGVAQAPYILGGSELGLFTSAASVQAPYGRVTSDLGSFGSGAFVLDPYFYAMPGLGNFASGANINVKARTYGAPSLGRLLSAALAHDPYLYAQPGLGSLKAGGQAHAPYIYVLPGLGGMSAAAVVTSPIGIDARSRIGSFATSAKIALLYRVSGNSRLGGFSSSVGIKIKIGFEAPPLHQDASDASLSISATFQLGSGNTLRI